ncbi:MAG: carbamoyltransferase [Deltaproteobacteria bacterium]|nr:carbamoyltransferase [Deltaproteobacteria bacterium]
MSDERVVLGINCAYHESAAALLRGGELVFAVEEERLSRVKHAKPARVDNADALPFAAIGECLRAGGVSLGEVDAVGFSLEPGRRVALVGRDPYPLADPRGFGSAEGEALFDAGVRRSAELLAEHAGVPGFGSRVRFLPHHLCHAASAYLGGPFSRAAVLVLDGIGEEATGWLGLGEEGALTRLEELPYPHSIGLLWEQLALYLGLGAYDAGKAMGLAACGDATRPAAALDRLFRVVDPDGRDETGPPYVVDAELARLRGDLSGFEALFGPRAAPNGGSPDEQPHLCDLAAAIQRRTEEALLACARRLARRTHASALCYAGGVALNCVANARLEREGPFEAIYVPGPAHDAGTALGAALLLGGARPRPEPLSPLVGPDYDDARLERALRGSTFLVEPLADPSARAAELVAAGEIVGWFHGRLELGPRALGSRSLLADPRRLDMRERLNRQVKHRELFRPFAASCLEEALDAWFEVPVREGPGAEASRELMLLAYPVRAERRAQIPAVVHRDGTCRIQTVDALRQPAYHALLARFFALTGVPLVLNTSFNDSEPIVCSPEDALATFGRTEIDALVIGDRLVRRRP